MKTTLNLHDSDTFYEQLLVEAVRVLEVQGGFHAALASEVMPNAR